MKNKKNLSIIIKIAIPVVILVIMLIIKFIKTSNEGFSLARYAIVNVEGVNGRGKVSLKLDDVGLYAALAGNEASESDKKRYKEFVDSVRFTASANEGLKNGKVITITAEYDEDAAEKAGVKTGKITREYKISGLVNGKALDAFSGISIETSGVSPLISATWTNESDNEYIKGLEYKLDKSTGIKVGDTITITCLANEAEAAKAGFYFDKLSMEYTITRADAYVSKAEEIDWNIIKDIVSEGTDTITRMTSDTTSHMSYKVTGNKGYLYRDGNEEAVNFALSRVELVSNTMNFANKHQNYILIYLYGQIRVPNYTQTEDPYEYIDSYFCFIYNDAVIDTEGKFNMALNDIEKRFYCATTYEGVLGEVMEQIGPGYEYAEIPLK